MNRKVKHRAYLLATALIALAAMFMSNAPQFAQTSKESPRVFSPAEIYFIDGRASLGEKGRLQCGAGSPIAMGSFGGPDAGGVTGPLVKLDLSFGTFPVVISRPIVVDDPFSRRDGYMGSFAVRNIYPAKPSRPETVAANHFYGTITSGGASPMRGGVTGFYLFGVTDFSSRLCGMKGTYDANRDARRYVRMTGTCGNDQEVTFQLSRRPPVDHNGDVNLAPTDIFAYGTFRGNISCGRTIDRNRVRTNLTTAR